MTNIRNQNVFTQSWWDWTPYNSCFEGTNIRISDIDGIVERRGHFLWIETKRPGEEITKGQDIIHKALIDTGSFCVLLLWGEVNEPESYRLIFEGGKAEEAFVMGTKEMKLVVGRWFRWANRQKAIE